MSVMEVRDLWWKYRGGGDYVLRGVNLSVREREFLVIMGRSGAGKTTLLLALNGVIPKRLPGEFRGAISLLGRDTSSLDVAEIANYVATVFEDPEIQFVMSTVEDEIVLGLEALGLSEDEIRERIEWSLELVGLGRKFLERNPYQLSGGEKQRVAIASALARRPRILLLDEPTSDLDPKGKKEVVDAIRRLREELDITVVMVEHDPDLVYEFADRVVVLARGKVVASGDPADVLGDPSLRGEGVFPPQVLEVARALSLNHGVKSEEDLVDRIRSKGFSVKGEEKIERGESGKIVVSCEGVKHVYEGGIEALRSVNFQLRLGELVALVGPNGSGKSTLAKIIAGLLKPTSGRVVIEGLPIDRYDRMTLSSLVGYVYQNPDHQIFNQTVFDEVAFGLRLRGLSEHEIRRRVRGALETFGLLGKEEEHPFFLSKGERRRLALASIYVLNPRVLIVDEPTTGQDMIFNRALFDLLKRVSKENRSVLVITHSLNLAYAYADRMVIIKDGRILAEGRPCEIALRDNVLREANLNAPPVSRVYRRLVPESTSVPITVKDFIERVSVAP